MATLNPFYDDEEFPNSYSRDGGEFDEITLNSDEKEDAATNMVISVDDVASYLVKEKFLLTALEFHTELVESRKELPRLRDFFSNPGNFERTKLSPAVSASGLRKFSLYVMT